MDLKKITGAIAGFALFLAVTPAWAGKAPVVTVSIKPVHSIVAYLMKGVAKPELIVGGNKTPLDYSLDKAQAELLAKSDLIIWIGPELESFLVQPLKNLKGKTKIMEMLANQAFKVLSSRNIDGQRDPYIWLDVRNAEIFVDELYKSLIAVDPERSKIYEKNRKELKYRIVRLDREFEYGFRAIAAGTGWAYHDTQQYFAQSYALHLKGFLSSAPGKIADMRQILLTRAAITGKGKTCLFVETGLSTDKLSMLTSAPEVRLAELDSFATRFTPGPELYEKMMQFNFNAISNCYSAIGAVYTGPYATRPK